MKNRYVNYFSVHTTTTGRHYSINTWDDVLKCVSFFSDCMFTPDELKHW